MPKSWTFGRQVAVGFAIVVLLSVGMGGVAISALGAVVDAKDRVIREHAEVLVDAQRLQTAAEQRAGAQRGYLLAENQRFLDSIAAADREAVALLGRLRAAAPSPEEQALLDQIEQASERVVGAADALNEQRRQTQDLALISDAFLERLLPARDALKDRIDAFVTLEEGRLARARQEASDLASRASAVLGAAMLATVALALGLSFALTRSLTQQVGTAVGRVQSSSTELQAAANQQASGAREQATAMREIATTITELLASSRQIAESAQRVAGPGAVVEVLRALPAPSRGPILVVLHLGRTFGAALADWLDGQTAHRVSFARHREPLSGVAGRVVLAPPDLHLVVRGELLELSGAPERHSCRPSVDALFESLAVGHAAVTAAALLTGMGRDGAAGLLLLRQRGALTIAQDEATSVVWGMPGEAARRGAAARILPLAEIGPALAGTA